MLLRSGRVVGIQRIALNDLDKRVSRLVYLLDRVTTEFQECGRVPRNCLLGAINFLRYHCMDLLAQLPNFAEAVLAAVALSVTNMKNEQDAGFPVLENRINASYQKLERKMWRMESRCDYVPRIV